MTATPMKLLERIAVIATRDPTRIAYCAARDGRTLTYLELNGAIASAFEAAPAFASTAIVVASNRIDFAGVFLGLLSAGVNVFPVIGTTTRQELSDLVARVNAATLVADDPPRGDATLPPTRSFSSFHAAPSADERTRPPGDLLLASSGSAGVPKIVRRTAASLDAVAANVVDAVRIAADDRVLAIVPLAHSYGLEHGLLAPLWAGATTTLCDGLDLSSLAAALATTRVTTFPTVPAVIERLIETTDRLAGLGTLRTIYSAGGPLPDDVRHRFVGRFGIAPGQLYGSTELGSVTYRDGSDGDSSANVGKPMRDVSIRVVDGEVAIRAPSMFGGYVGEPSPVVDGHFVTGDLGHLADDGSLVLTGRSKLLIDTGGPKVDPLEVERVLAAHPAVAECCIVALRQSESVARLRAIVVCRLNVERPTADSLRAFVRERLAPHKVPRVVEFRDTLPRSAAGKIARHRLEGE